MAKKQTQAGSTNVMFIGIIVILIAVMGGMFYYFTQMQRQPSTAINQPTTTTTDTTTTPTGSTPPGAKTIAVPQEEIATEFGSATVKINSITRNTSGITVNFTLACKDANCTRVVNNANEPDRYGASDEVLGNYDIFQAYLVDANSLKKYEVLKDATGKYLATEPFKISPFLRGESKAMTITFTNPPAEVTTINLHIPKVQVVSNIAI